MPVFTLRTKIYLWGCNYTLTRYSKMPLISTAAQFTPPSDVKISCPTCNQTMHYESGTAWCVNEKCPNKQRFNVRFPEVHVRLAPQ